MANLKNNTYYIQLYLVFPVGISYDILLLLDILEVVVPPGLLYTVFVVETGLLPILSKLNLQTSEIYYRLQTDYYEDDLESVSVKRLESVETLVGAVCPPVPPDPRRPGQLVLRLRSG